MRDIIYVGLPLIAAVLTIVASLLGPGTAGQAILLASAFLMLCCFFWTMGRVQKDNEQFK